MDKSAEFTTETEYSTGLVAVERYFDREPAIGSAEAHGFDLLAQKIATYEAQHWPMDIAL